ncbi:MAG: hypothetical protein BJ554DRAFT_7203 [Olpidium bornovanus]|uniref:Uncharacterized protein n=1 Tax=Olpidium bornovanus TaxID=278681 RepID=A0A8H7ZWJ1_9FUNG|nr:MAG: hypothetical protein BJ554DRAFT_7203 [Olpidium bornovanus]
MVPLASRPGLRPRVGGPSLDSAADGWRAGPIEPVDLAQVPPESAPLRRSLRRGRPGRRRVRLAGRPLRDPARAGRDRRAQLDHRRRRRGRRRRHGGSWIGRRDRRRRGSGRRGVLGWRRRRRRAGRSGQRLRSCART